MRNVKKTIEAYTHMKHGKYEMSAAEIMEIKRLSDIKEPNGIYTAIMNAAMFGYVVGYRAAKREAKQKKQKK